MSSQNSGFNSDFSSKSCGLEASDSIRRSKDMKLGGIGERSELVVYAKFGLRTGTDRARIPVKTRFLA